MTPLPGGLTTIYRSQVSIGGNEFPIAAGISELGYGGTASVNADAGCWSFAHTVLDTVAKDLITGKVMITLVWARETAPNQGAQNMYVLHIFANNPAETPVVLSAPVILNLLGFRIDGCAQDDPFNG